MFANRYFSPFLYALIVALLTAIVTFPPLIGTWNSQPPLWSISDLVSNGPLNAPYLYSRDWNNRNIFLNLFIFFLTRYILTPVSIIMPVPCGLFVPLLTIGAAVGRIFGELAVQGLPTVLLFEGSQVFAGGYAIVGAAAFTAATTQTLSAAVIVFELTGSIVYGVPVLVAVMVSVGIVKRLRLGPIYDCMATLKGLPFLPDLLKESYNVQAKDIMSKDLHYITTEFLLDDIKRVLIATNVTIIPVVNTSDAMLLMGTVNRDQLEKLVRESITESKEESPQSPEIRSTPIRFLETTALTQIHLLFITLRLSYGFVTANGKLRGVITRTILQDTIIKLDHLRYTLY